MPISLLLLVALETKMIDSTAKVLANGRSEACEVAAEAPFTVLKSGHCFFGSCVPRSGYIIESSKQLPV